MWLAVTACMTVIASDRHRSPHGCPASRVLPNLLLCLHPTHEQHTILLLSSSSQATSVAHCDGVYDGDSGRQASRPAWYPASPLALRPLGLLQHAVLARSLLRGLNSALCCFSNCSIVYTLHVSQARSLRAQK